MTHFRRWFPTNTAAMALLTCALGCTPAFNWRQVEANNAKVQLLLPCKPDQGTREVMLRTSTREVPTQLRMQGCEASGMQFTFAQMPLPEGMVGADAIDAWRLASLAPLGVLPSKASSERWQAKNIELVDPLARTLLVTERHQVQWVWFVVADTIYQAAVYGKPKDKGLPEAAETYFSGIQVP